MATLGEGTRHAILTGEGLLHTAVEEEGHMGVLFRLGDAQLGQAAVRRYTAPKILCRLSWGKATSTLGMVASY